MRIISQSGRVDIPYEMAVVYVEYESVIAKVGDERHAMGNYSTEEKAFKAMKMLRETWIHEVVEFTHGIYHRNIVFQFPQDDEIEV